MKITRYASFAVIGLALFGAACGGGASGGTGGDKSELETTTRTFIQSYSQGQSEKAYDLLSAQCQSQVSKDEFKAGSAIIAGFLGGKGKLDLKTFEVVEQSGDNAKVRVQVAATGLPAGVNPDDGKPTDGALVKEKGHWRIANCDCIL